MPGDAHSRRDKMYLRTFQDHEGYYNVRYAVNHGMPIFLLEYELLPHSWIVLDKLIY